MTVGAIGGGNVRCNRVSRRSPSRSLSLARSPAVRAAIAGMDSLFYADGALFERLYNRFKAAGQTDKARMIRRALFIHQ